MVIRVNWSTGDLKKTEQMEGCDGEDVEEGSLAPCRRHHLIFHRIRAVFHTSTINITALAAFFPGRGWGGLKKKREAFL